MGRIVGSSGSLRGNGGLLSFNPGVACFQVSESVVKVTDITVRCRRMHQKAEGPGGGCYRNGGGAWGETAQWAKCFPSKDDGLSWDSQHPCDSQAGMMANHQPQNQGGGHRGAPPGI